MPHRRSIEEDFQGEKNNVIGELASRLKKSSLSDESFPPPPPVFQTYAAQLSGQEIREPNNNKSNSSAYDPFPRKPTKVSATLPTSTDNVRKYQHKKCSTCGLPVVTGGGYANGKLFHQDCFTCTNCKASLDGKFFTQNGKQLCESCYAPHQKYCATCEKVITTNCVESNGNLYHAECLKCSLCNVSLQGAYFILGGKFLCEQDYKKSKKSCSDCGKLIDGLYYTGVDNMILCELDYKKRQGDCTRCGEFLEGNILKLPGYSYHASCFTCKVCGDNLAGTPVSIDNNNEIYCGEDFDKLFALKCGACKQPIVPPKGETTAPRIRALNKDFHPDCFKCAGCNLVLEDGCYPLDKKPFCMDCFEEKLNNC